jgi:hypothetical protein
LRDLRQVWDGCFKREVAKLEKVQLGSARIVTGLTKFASRDSLYYETGWEHLSCRRKSQIILTEIYQFWTKNKNIIAILMTKVPISFAVVFFFYYYNEIMKWCMHIANLILISHLRFKTIFNLYGNLLCKYWHAKWTSSLEILN